MTLQSIYPFHFFSHFTTLTAKMEDSYDPSTGHGALGVEFAGTAVTSHSAFGKNISPANADVISARLVTANGNEDLQWSEGSYRGFFTLTISPTSMNATYYGMRNISKYQIPTTGRHDLSLRLTITGKRLYQSRWICDCTIYGRGRCVVCIAPTCLDCV
jgi:PhoD-like phosphatase